MSDDRYYIISNQTIDRAAVAARMSRAEHLLFAYVMHASFPSLGLNEDFPDDWEWPELPPVVDVIEGFTHDGFASTLMAELIHDRKPFRFYPQVERALEFLLRDKIFVEAGDGVLINMDARSWDVSRRKTFCDFEHYVFGPRGTEPLWERGEAEEATNVES